jgi:hypothetical protein
MPVIEQNGIVHHAPGKQDARQNRPCITCQVSIS